MLRDSVILRAWAPEILLELGPGPRRYNYLLGAINGVSDRVLTERLRDLVDAGLVDRQVIVESPIRVSYALTIRGRRYLQPLIELAALDAEPARQESQVG